MGIVIKNKVIISLDSLSPTLSIINDGLVTQTTLLQNQLLKIDKAVHQLRITNMYSAHENDFIIDDNIFENDELN